MIAKVSSFQYRGERVDHQKILKELAAAYLVEGSVAKINDRIRISVGLIETKTGTRIWSDHYDRELKDIFDLQDNIVRSVVAAVEPNIRQSELKNIRNKPRANIDAYDFYMRAAAAYMIFDRKQYELALSEIDQALKLDPEFASAWALKADILARMVIGGWVDRGKNGPEVITCAEKAISLDPEDGFALSMAGWAYSIFAQDLPRSLDLTRKALAKQPSSAIVRVNAAFPLIYDGQSDAALEQLQLAHELNPLDPSHVNLKFAA